MGRATSTLHKVITIVTLLITLLISTHEPPSRTLKPKNHVKPETQTPPELRSAARVAHPG